MVMGKEEGAGIALFLGSLQRSAEEFDLAFARKRLRGRLSGNALLAGARLES